VKWDDQFIEEFKRGLVACKVQSPIDHFWVIDLSLLSDLLDDIRTDGCQSHVHVVLYARWRISERHLD
jgi:hypothetical protein